MQEAVVVALVSLSRLATPERFGAWLAGIALNIARRWLRDTQRPTVTRLSDDSELIDPDATPEEHVVQLEMAARIRAAVTQLAPGQRDAVMLFYLEGLTYHEAAIELGISVNAVKARLHQARAALALNMSALSPHEERPPMTPTGNWIDMRVAEVRRGDNTGLITPHVVLLSNASGTRHLPIWTGAPEATALAVTLVSSEMPRPMTYQLASNLLTAAGARVTEVRITRLLDSTFYAVVVLDGPNGPHEVDSRPSDALNLALVCEAPIRVSGDVLPDPAATDRSEWRNYSITATDIVAELHQRQEEGMRYLREQHER